MYKLFFLLAFFGYAACDGVFAQKTFLPAPAPIVHPLSPAAVPTERGFDIEAALTQAFDSTVALSSVKGINAAVYLPDGIIWKRAHGVSAAGEPLTTEHLMEMGSITKTFVATTLLLLVEEGIVSLDDSIGTFLSAYPYISGAATVRQVLSHTTGFFDITNESDSLTNTWLEHPDSLWQVDSMLTHFMQPPHFQPGEGFFYSNVNYFIAGRLIEEIEGKPWYEVVRERIVQPLGLVHTYASPWEENLANGEYTHPWGTFGGELPLVDLLSLGIPVQGYHSIANAAGSLVTTPEDLVVFMQRLAGGDILQPATLAAMQTDYVQDAAAGLQYGLGLLSYDLGGIVNYGHDGSLLHKSISMYFPQYGFSIAVQQNDERTATNDAPQFVDFSSVFFALLQTAIQILPVTPVIEPVGQTAIAIFPNPAADYVMVEWNESLLTSPRPWQLLHPSGKVVREGLLTEMRTALSLAGVAPGMYYLRVADRAVPVVVGFR